MRISSWFAGILCLTIIFFTACRPKGHSTESVEQAMQKYDRYILRMDVDSISLLYAPDGELGKMAKGRDSIRRFLGNFKKYKVLSQISKTNLININRDTALQTGLYTQKVIAPVNDTVTVKGLFSAKWIWMDSTGWHIQRMETQPAK
jgi:hypothetical protein